MQAHLPRVPRRDPYRTSRAADPGRHPIRLADLPKEERSTAIPTLKESFEGYYRWHAKRTLRDVERVRVARLGGQVVAVSMFERLRPEVGYVNYLAVARAYRRAGFGGRLLDDALRRLKGEGVEVVFAAAETSNQRSLALLRSRGFRRTRRKERTWSEGGLGAWGLRSRMHIVSGEVIVGLRLRPADPPRA